ncbi:MAG TPA: hypothetical protein VGF56_06990 [Rhizomicrobium sp.]|jgi:hypothetical protein
MSELDLINLGRSATANEVSWFAQIITINFAMVVGIYYFLHHARLAMKLFAFLVYSVGMLLYLGEMLLETSMKATVLIALQAVPHPSLLTQEYIGLAGSWLGITTVTLFNGAFWILWLGMAYLLFFWRRGEEA